MDPCEGVAHLVSLTLSVPELNATQPVVVLNPQIMVDKTTN